APETIETYRFTGQLVSSRAVDDEVFLVLTDQIAVPQVQTICSDDGAKCQYETFDAYAERFLASASLDSMMPAVQTGSDDAAVPLVTPDKIFRPHEGEDPRQLLTLAVLD